MSRSTGYSDGIAWTKEDVHRLKEVINEHGLESMDKMRLLGGRSLRGRTSPDIEYMIKFLVDSGSVMLKNRTHLFPSVPVSPEQESFRASPFRARATIRRAGRA